MGKDVFDSTYLHTAVPGVRVIPVDSPDLTPPTGTTAVHITHFPPDNQVRENLIHNVASVTSVSVEIVAYHEVTRQILSRPSEDSRDPPAGGPDIQARQNIPMYTADLSRLLLLCGDIESNPGPTDRGADCVTRNQQTDDVSVEICIFQNYMLSYHFLESRDMYLSKFFVV